MFGEVKKYALIHLDFAEKKYGIYYYEKCRRFTSGQAWDYIHNEDPSVTGSLEKGSNIFMYYTLIDSLGLNEKYCDRYCSFNIV